MKLDIPPVQEEEEVQEAAPMLHVKSKGNVVVGGPIATFAECLAMQRKQFALAAKEAAAK